MLRTTLTGVLYGLCLASSGFGAVDIEEWSGAGSGFYIHTEQYIEITAAGTYYFQSYDGATPADIHDIYITEGGVAGTVTIYIYQDPNDGDGPGAANVEQIDLSGATTGNLGQLYISSGLATEGDAVCDNITDDITIGGDMATGGDVDCDNLVGNIIVGGTHGDGPGSTTYRLHADTGTGDIAIGGDCVGNLELGTYTTGEITIGRVAHPSRSEGWGRDCVEQAPRRRRTPSLQARHFVAVS